MTPKEAKQFNTMLAALKTMANGYETTSQLRRSAEKHYGPDYKEVLEMAYENMQGVAKRGCKGIKPISLPKP